MAPRSCNLAGKGLVQVHELTGMRATTLIGRRVADRFTITRFLGEGGMATVFVAQQAGEPPEVALKIMNEELTADRSFVKRFQREAKAAARVQHPNSVAFIDYGVADGLSYIAMELLQGDDLYVLLERDGAITQARAARIVVEVCEALVVAHELGIVHRDLKPENIMIVPDSGRPQRERVKVLDFGIAKLLAPDVQTPNNRIDPSSGVTRAGTFIGTPAYMSPEQCGLLEVDTRADIYTCGVLLFQMITGRLPFEGQTPLHTATLHIHEPAPRPSGYAPSIDPRMEAVILKALSKSPDDRYQTAAELASTLRTLLVDLPDTRVANVPKPVAGSLSGRTRNSAASSMSASMLRAPPSSDPLLEAAKTMVAKEGDKDVPVSLGPRTRVPSSDPITDRRPDGSSLRGPASPPTAGKGPPRPSSMSVPKPPRPAAGVPGRVPPAPAPPPSVEAPADSDDLMRTLVRAPLDEDTNARLGPQKTEVIVATSVEALEAEALSLGSPAGVAQTPPGASAAAGPPAKPKVGSTPPPRPGPPRPMPKPTLKSALDFKGVPAKKPAPVESAEFKLGSTGAKLGSAAPASISSRLSSDEITITPVIPVRAPQSLGSMRLGGGKLASARDDEEPETDQAAVATPLKPPTTPPPPRPSTVPARLTPAPPPPLGPGLTSMANPGGVPLAPPPPALVEAPPVSQAAPTPPLMVPPAPVSVPTAQHVVVTPAGFGETTRMDVRDPSLQMPGRHPPGLGNAATVPMISASFVADVVAKGPPPAAGRPAQPPQGALQMGAQVAQQQAGLPIPRQLPAAPPAATAPMLAHVVPVSPAANQGNNVAALAPTPPVYPLDPRAAAGSNISGARGLLLGFFAGAVVVALAALIYLALRP